MEPTSSNTALRTAAEAAPVSPEPCILNSLVPGRKNEQPELIQVISPGLGSFCTNQSRLSAESPLNGQTPFLHEPRLSLPTPRVPRMTSSVFQIPPTDKSMPSIDIQLEIPQIKDIRHGKSHHNCALAK